MFDEDEEPIGGQTLAAPDKEFIILDGLLKKKSPKGFIKAWQERYICLTREGLFYFKRKDSPHHQGAIPILAISEVESDPSTYKKKGYRMDIKLDGAVSNRVFSFTAKTEAEIEKWVREIRLVLIDARSRHREENNDMVDQTSAPVAGGDGKFWKQGGMVTAARRDDKRNLDLTIFLNTFKPTYPVLSAPPRVVVDASTKLASVFFGQFKIESQEQCGPLGEIYLLANPHYVITHQSYLIHSIPFSSPHHDIAVNSMQLISQLNYPLFPQQIASGVTSDSTYCIYRPPLRSTHDSIFAWLDKVKNFPEDVVAHLLLQILITFQYLHSNNIQLYLLSPDTTYFDADGVFRIADFYLGAPPSSIVHLVAEYTPPETVIDGPDASTIASDYWKLGVFLYEITCGVPPFRADSEKIDPTSDVDPIDQYNQMIYDQLASFDITTLDFPPFVSNELKTLIQGLLQPDPKKRLCNIETITKEYEFVSSIENLDEKLQLDYYFQNPPLPWIYDNIIQPLARSKDTPINLTFSPEQVSLRRLVVKILYCRQLFIDNNLRIGFVVHSENDVQKSPLYAQSPMPYQELLATEGLLGMQPDVIHSNAIKIGAEYIFDYFTPTFTLNSEITIEVYGRRNDTDKGILIGCVSFPLKDLSTSNVLNSWCPIIDSQGLSVGEVKLRLDWESEMLNVDNSILAGLTDGTKSFAESFAKPVPRNQGKLWSCVVDPSSVATADLDNNPNQTNTMNLNTINASGAMSPSFNTLKGTGGSGSGSGPGSNLNTLNLSSSSKAMQLLSGGTPPHSANTRNIFDPLPTSNSGSILSSHTPTTPRSMLPGSNPSQFPQNQASGESPRVSGSAAGGTTPILPAVPMLPSQQLPAQEDPTKWKTTTDSKGNMYYYNTVTKDTSWTPPPCGVIAADGTVIAPPSQPQA